MNAVHPVVRSEGLIELKTKASKSRRPIEETDQRMKSKIKNGLSDSEMLP